jgi:hypothetical protein
MISELSNYYEIQRNWSHYRCMPSITPFAAFYGFNLSETLNFCVAESVREHAPGVINPIYKGINEVTGIVDGVYDKVVAIEGGVGSLLKGFEGFVINFVNSFRLLGTRIRMSFVRIKDIFARVYGIFIAFSYAAISAITFGENLICNPLVVFLGTVTGVDICCFAPDTRIRLADGSTKPIAECVIGDELFASSKVTSTYLFDGSRTKMIRIRGVHVSANHYIEGPEPGQMIQAGDHPEAVAAESLERLWCLGTANNRMTVVTNMGDHVFADYEESSDPDVVATVQAVAERTLNNREAGPTVPDYSLGLDPTLLVYMKDTTLKPLSQVRIDDDLMGGGRVTGIIREVCEQQCKTPAGHTVAAAQLILHEHGWTRAAHIWPRYAPVTPVLYHLMTTAPFTVGGDGEIFMVRDYAEVSTIDMQTPYDKKLTAQSATLEKVR